MATRLATALRKTGSDRQCVSLWHYCRNGRQAKWVPDLTGILARANSRHDPPMRCQSESDGACHEMPHANHTAARQVDSVVRNRIVQVHQPLLNQLHDDCRCKRLRQRGQMEGGRSRRERTILEVSIRNGRAVRQRELQFGQVTPPQPPSVCAHREGRAVDLADGVLLLRRDGTEVPVGGSAAPLRDRSATATGPRSGWCWSFMTSRKRRVTLGVSGRSTWDRYHAHTLHKVMEAGQKLHDPGVAVEKRQGKQQLTACRTGPKRHRPARGRAVGCLRRAGRRSTGLLLPSRCPQSPDRRRSRP